MCIYYPDTPYMPYICRSVGVVPGGSFWGGRTMAVPDGSCGIGTWCEPPSPFGFGRRGPLRLVVDLSDHVQLGRTFQTSTPPAAPRPRGGLLHLGTVCLRRRRGHDSESRRARREAEAYRTVSSSEPGREAVGPGGPGAGSRYHRT